MPTAEANHTLKLLNFTYTAEQINQLKDTAIRDFNAKIDAIVAMDKKARTFENTILAYESAGDDFSDAVEMPMMMAYVSTDKAVRDASTELASTVQKFAIELLTRRDLYQALKSVNTRKNPLPPLDKRLYDKVLLDFKRNGLDLSDEDMAKFKELKKKMSDLQIAFDKNLRDFKDELHLTQEEMKGLPENYLKGLKKDAEGKYIVTMDYPDYVPFMDNADNGDARKRLEFKFNNRCAQQNTAIFNEVIQLRAQIAALLGYKTYAAYVLEERMAKNPRLLNGFFKRLNKKLRPKAKSELKERITLKRQESGSRENLLNAWEWRYWNNRYRKTKAGVDHEKIKEYFPLEFVMKGLINVFETVFSVEFRKSDIPVWHQDVTPYEIVNKGDGSLVGYFYMDLFPREGKYKHAACFGMVAGKEMPDGSYRAPAAAIVANFPKPTPETPSLFTHDEVTTLFHEFGHVTHNLFTRSKYSRFAGTSVSRDYVEVPSKMLENWTWYPEVLKTISSHYKDGSKLPDELINRLIADKNADSGLVNLRQLFFSMVDIELHTKPPADPTALYAEWMKKVSFIPMTPGTNPLASFSHLIHGYEAGYYSYMWSEMLASDIFSVFAEKGIMNPEVGRKYRECILAPGKTIDELEQVRNFLGRDPQEEAFVKSLGLN